MTKVKLIRIGNLNVSHPPCIGMHACTRKITDLVTQASSIPILSAADRFYLRIVPTERDKARFTRGRVLCPTSNALFVHLSIFGRDEILRALVRRSVININPPCQSHMLVKELRAFDFRPRRCYYIHWNLQLM